jgi:DNA repair exonuclease SbcCD nuclease subunit
MPPILLLSDVHIGHRNDSAIHDHHLRKYFVDVIIPTCVEKNINNIIVCGDLFDRRKFINFEILYKWKREVFDILHQHMISVHVVVGNHDVAFKNTNKVNSPELILAEYPYIQVYCEPKDAHIQGVDFAMIPWINEENREETYEYIRTTGAPIAIAHLEVNGFSMRPGESCEHGIGRDLFERFASVYTGHFHLQSEQGNIRYMGCPTEHSLGEAGHATGFHLLDTDTLELTFVENPNKLYIDITYVGKATVIPDGITGKFVRIYNKSNDKKFNAFVAGVEQHLAPYRIECFDVVDTQEDAVVAVTDLKDVKDMTNIIRDIVVADTTIDLVARENILKLANELYQASLSK